ncbi:MAG: class I SAM-dependent methyltransferase [Candidatus Peregrinibacteria bacterium]|nr:class I SAM-dependent methyltransferase [Candidatus Peregrinibacteria bacterium]
MKRGLDPKTGYARYAQQYDERERFWDSFEQDKLAPYINEAQGLEVLDAGAGTGRLSLKLHKAGAHVTALDISPEMLAILKQKEPGINPIEGDMERMPFEDESFDMVFSSLALVHLKKVEPFLDECYRVLKDDGRMVLVNIHYRKAEVLNDSQGRYTIAGYNHFPRHVREAAESLAFGIEHDEIITEGDDVWVSQVLVLRK